VAYLTTTILQEALGTSKVTSLTGGHANQLARLVTMATAETRSALSIGGYASAVPETIYAADASDCPGEIQLAAIGAWIEIAYGVNDLDVPQQFNAYIAKLEELKAGKLEIATVARNTVRAVGGVSFSTSSPTLDASDGNGGTQSRKQIFGRGPMSGY